MNTQESMATGDPDWAPRVLFSLLSPVDFGTYMCQTPTQAALNLRPTCYGQHVTAATLTVNVNVICKRAVTDSETDCF